MSTPTAPPRKPPSGRATWTLSVPVAIIPGNAFGASGEGYARVSYAYSVEHLMEAIRRIREFLNENCK